MDFDTLSDDVLWDQTTNILSVSTKDYPTTHHGLGYDFFKSMQQNKDKVAQYIAETGETDTYENLLKRSIRAALHLRTRNLTKDDVVCLCSYNHKHSVVPFIACLFLGVKIASLDPSFSIGDATHLIKIVRPRVFFIVPEVIDVITTSINNAELHTEIVVYHDDVDTEKFTPFDSFLTEHEDEELFTPVEITDVLETAVIFFSSGTTGLPKGICCSHLSIYHQGYLIEHLGMLGPKPVVLIFSTLYWVSSVLNLTACILHGGARLVCTEFDANKVWELIDKFEVSYCFFAPIQCYKMISAGRPDDIDTSKLLVILTGGAHFAEEKMHEFRDLMPGTFISQGYGCSEVSGGALFYNVTKTKDRLMLHYKPTSTGRPVPGFEYRIVNPETEENCGPNERGELRLRSKFVLNGYYKQDSSSAFDSEGWMRTGDVFYYDTDFCFYIVDRIKEMLKYRSWHVPPALLEQIIQGHPAVSRAVVIGIPHEIDGDHPLAVIILDENYDKSITTEEIEKFVEERVNDTHRLRAGVRFVKTLPVTPSGKIRKNELRELVLQGLI